MEEAGLAKLVRPDLDEVMAIVIVAAKGGRESSGGAETTG